MTAFETTDTASSFTNNLAIIGEAWGIVIVAALGFTGILVTQIVTNHREKSLQERQLEHQTGAELRLRRTLAYSELIDAVSHFMLAIPDVLLPESTSGDLNAEERGPITRASSKSQLLASRPVQKKITELMDAAYAYADDINAETWQALDDSMDTFVDAAQAEAAQGDGGGPTESKKHRRFGKSGG